MMNNNGLYIKEFEARGENVSTSKLTFQKGCNVVLGKSDTGKTTLYSIIEFVLGKGSIAYIIHSGFISGYQNRYGDNLKPPTNVYHRMTA